MSHDALFQLGISALERHITQAEALFIALAAFAGVLMVRTFGATRPVGHPAAYALVPVSVRACRCIAVQGDASHLSEF